MLINPITLLQRIKKAKSATPKLWIQALKESKLEDINRDNLLRGKDSEGQDMPLYAPTEYGLDKSNPLNRGHWDLKLTGQYHLGITAKITSKEVSFYQKYNNKKIQNKRIYL